MSVFRKQTSRKGSVVYQQVLQKNFEIIQTFLKKFHQIFTKQDQFQQHLNKFAEKFTEYQQILEQFRQEQRLSVVMLQKKVNNMKNTVRQSHRASHRFSKINIPVFEAVQTPQGTKNYTLLKFDSIQNGNHESQQINFGRKQSLQSGLSMKQYEQMKQSIQSVRQQINQMKDKISFLSAYTSSISSQQGNKSNMETVKKEIIQVLQSDSRNRVQRQIRKQMVQTEKVFIQQVNNLAMQFSDELTQSMDKKYDKIQDDISKLDGLLYTREQAQGMRFQIKKDMKIFAGECMKIFMNKQQSKKSMNIIQRKIKNIESTLHSQLINKNEQDKQQHNQYLQSLLLINSNHNNINHIKSNNFNYNHNISNHNNNINNNNNCNNNQNHLHININNKSSSLYKTNKSHSQFIKHKHHSSSMTFDDQSKQNTTRKTYKNKTNIIESSKPLLQSSKPSLQSYKFQSSKTTLQLSKGNIDLSKGTLVTSQVSKQFMKNFGVKQRKLIKTNFHPKNQSNFNQTIFNNQIIRPQTALKNNVQFT